MIKSFNCLFIIIEDVYLIQATIYYLSYDDMKWNAFLMQF